MDGWSGNVFLCCSVFLLTSPAAGRQNWQRARVEKVVQSGEFRLSCILSFFFGQSRRRDMVEGKSTLCP